MGNFEIKTCIKCNGILSIESFAKKRNCCKPCYAAYHREWSAQNKQKRNSYREKWLINNKEKRAEYLKKWRSNNPKWQAIEKKSRHKNKEKRSVFYKTWYKNNYDKIRKYKTQNRKTLYEYERKWRLENKDKVNAKTSKCRAMRLRAMPLWANEIAIKAFYKKAQNLTKQTGIPHEVDHIIPLQGKSVTGFHVENNLRVISLLENRRKSNKWEISSL